MNPPTPPESAAPPQPAFVLGGTLVSPGLAAGRAWIEDSRFSNSPPQRIPREGIERELNRFRTALRASHGELAELRSRLRGALSEQAVAILDAHLAQLKDSVFLTDVENLILDEGLRLEAAVGKVVADCERLFGLAGCRSRRNPRCTDPQSRLFVASRPPMAFNHRELAAPRSATDARHLANPDDSDSLLAEDEEQRKRAIDLCDVGLRVLRHVEPRTARPIGSPDTILITRVLSIVDLVDLEGRSPAGIAVQEGELAGRAATLACSLCIPTLMGVEGLMERVAAGDSLIVDATGGVLRVN